MQGQRISVSEEFKEAFTHFYAAENKTTEAVAKTLLPSFQTILIFSFGTPVFFTSPRQTKLAIDKCLILGPVKQPIDYTLPPNADILVANFKADAFYRFFGQSLASEHMPIHPDDLLDENCFTNLWRLLRDKPSADRVPDVLEFCRPYLKKRDAAFERIATFNNTSESPIKAIAEETQQSERTVQLNHKKYLGYSAKEINRYHRFLNAIQQLQKLSETTTLVDWHDLVIRCGYYDQSQLIHDFKHYLNLSPTQFLKFQQDVCMATPA